MKLPSWVALRLCRVSASGAFRSSGYLHESLLFDIVRLKAAGRQTVQMRSKAGQSLRTAGGNFVRLVRSEEHTSELQSLMRISYAVFCLKKKTLKHNPSDQH